MDLGLKDQLFVVAGATSGFGHAIANALLQEGASIVAVARNAEKLEELLKTSPERIATVAGDISDQKTHELLLAAIGERQLHGALINASGPPAKTVMETTVEDWDNAYRQILRWKIQLSQLLVTRMKNFGYGRLLYIESASVKQPLENLVLSNSLRLAVVGFVKTFSQEISRTGITMNILGPGSHDTPAIQRVFQKKAEQTGDDIEITREKSIAQIPVGRLGNAADFASLACWLLSPSAGYVTGQTITIDGGAVKGSFG